MKTKEKTEGIVSKDKVVLWDMVREEGALGNVFNLGFLKLLGPCSAITKKSPIAAAMERRSENLAK